MPLAPVETIPNLYPMGLSLHCRRPINPSKSVNLLQSRERYQA